MMTVILNIRQLQGGIFKHLIVYCSNLPPSIIPFIQPLKLHTQHGCLQLIKTVLKSNDLMDEFHALTNIAQNFNLFIEFLIVGSDDAAVAISAHVFTRIEGKSSCMPKRTHPPSLVIATMSMRCILQHP